MRRTGAGILIRFALVLSAFFALGAVDPAWAAPTVLELEVTGAITPVVAGYVARGLDVAESDRDAAVVLLLDTPGGLDSAMRTIVQRVEASRVPVLVYVSPAGGRAASAGVYITMAAPVAAMAPNTAIGAASPVSAGGGDIGATMKAKVTNDAAAYLRGIARSHGRNAEWAEAAVRHAVSATAEEAVRLHVVDLVAPDVPTLLDRVDGRTVKVGHESVVLHLEGARVETFDWKPMERFLQQISDPSVAMLLLNVGMLGIFFELSNPGLVIPGIVGGICLLLAVFALGMLPVNAVGVALIGFAFLLFIAELFVPSWGALAVGGVISLVLGASMLVAPGMPGFEVSRTLVLTMALSFGGAMALLATLAVRAQRRKVTTGAEGLVGAVAEVRSPLDPEGQVFVQGARWRAVSTGPSIPAGARVVVQRVEDLTLFVAPHTTEFVAHD